MDIPVGIIFGIIAMISWGTADFFVVKAVRKISVFKTFVWSQIIGIILFFLIFSVFFKFPVMPYNIIIIILITGFLGVISYLAFCKGLQIGKVSIVSPIAASWSVITVILCLFLLKEKLTNIQSFGISLAIIGAVLVSFKSHDLLKLRIKNIAVGVKYALIALFGWGFYMFLVGVLVDKLGWFLPIFFIKAVVVFYLLSYSGISKQDIKFPKNVCFFILRN